MLLKNPIFVNGVFSVISISSQGKNVHVLLEILWFLMRLNSIQFYFLGSVCIVLALAMPKISDVCYAMTKTSG